MGQGWGERTDNLKRFGSWVKTGGTVVAIAVGLTIMWGGFVVFGWAVIFFAGAFVAEQLGVEGDAFRIFGWTAAALLLATFLALVGWQIEDDGGGRYLGPR